jgi:hypothetical protein
MSEIRATIAQVLEVARDTGINFTFIPDPDGTAIEAAYYDDFVVRHYLEWAPGPRHIQLHKAVLAVIKDVSLRAVGPDNAERKH